jgi:branched-subunit amino acid aminotransferase/4-amino-4-deoxychorismate lyase
MDSETNDGIKENPNGELPSRADVFETFMVLDNGYVFLMDEHLERMEKSIRELELGALPDTQKLKEELAEFAQREENRNRIMRLEYSAGRQGMPHLAIAFRDRKAAGQHDDGVRLLVADVRRNPLSYSVYHKTGNYLENRIALRNANNEGFDDALFLNINGDVAETSKSNIFLVNDGILITPSIESGILPGIVRAWVIRYAKECGYSTLEVFIDEKMLSDADEIFVTNSVIGIEKVSLINNVKKILFSSSGNSPVTTALHDAFEKAGREQKKI